MTLVFPWIAFCVCILPAVPASGRVSYVRAGKLIDVLQGAC
jgi:hypothetical protein